MWNLQLKKNSVEFKQRNQKKKKKVGLEDFLATMIRQKRKWNKTSIHFLISVAYSLLRGLPQILQNVLLPFPFNPFFRTISKVWWKGSLRTKFQNSHFLFLFSWPPSLFLSTKSLNLIRSAPLEQNPITLQILNCLAQPHRQAYSNSAKQN